MDVIIEINKDPDRYVCSIEQAKQLVEIGVKQDSLFCYYRGKVWLRDQVPDELPFGDFLPAYIVSEMNEMAFNHDQDIFIRVNNEHLSICRYNEPTFIQYNVMSIGYGPQPIALADALIDLLRQDND